MNASANAADVVHGEVEPLGAGRRHDVRGVASEEQPAVPQRLGDEAAERRDRLLDRGPVLSDAAVSGLSRARNSSQKRSSLQSSTFSVIGTCT